MQESSVSSQGYQSSENFILRQIADQHVLIPVARSPDQLRAVYVLNQTSAELWAYLREPRSQRNLQDWLLGEFDVEEPTATKDIAKFLDTLVGFGALYAIAL